MEAAGLERHGERASSGLFGDRKVFTTGIAPHGGRRRAAMAAEERGHGGDRKKTSPRRDHFQGKVGRGHQPLCLREPHPQDLVVNRVPHRPMEAVFEHPAREATFADDISNLDPFARPFADETDHRGNHRIGNGDGLRRTASDHADRRAATDRRPRPPRGRCQWSGLVASAMPVQPCPWGYCGSPGERPQRETPTPLPRPPPQVFTGSKASPHRSKKGALPLTCCQTKLSL